MTRSLSGLCVAGLGLCAAGWIIMKAMAWRGLRADEALADDPERASGQAVPRGPLPVPSVDLPPGTRGPLAVAEGEDAWW
jgi:hypothetical protein